MLNESRVENERQGKCVSFGNPTTCKGKTQNTVLLFHPSHKILQTSVYGYINPFLL